MTPEERARLAYGVQQRFFQLVDSAIAAEQAKQYDQADRTWPRVRRLRRAFVRITDRHLFDFLQGTDIL